MNTNEAAAASARTNGDTVNPAPEAQAVPAASEPELASRRVLVVVNTGAGSYTPDAVQVAFSAHGDESKLCVDIRVLEGGAMRAAVQRALATERYDIVAAAGGDGTVATVASVLVGGAIPLAILPAGTANVLARELGIPVEISAACALVAGEHRLTTIDAMQVGENYAFLQIGIGLDAVMIRDTPRESKKRFGRAAYLWTALRQVAGYTSLRFTVVADGKRLRRRALNVLIANGGTLGTAGLRWGPHITPDDGRIDVGIYRAHNARSMARLVWDVVRGRHFESQQVDFLEAYQSIMVHSDQPLPIQADGEIIGHTPVQVKVVPAALQVVVPYPTATQRESTMSELADGPPPTTATAAPVNRQDDPSAPQLAIETHAAAATAREALERALAEVKTPEQARRMIDAALAAAEGVQVRDLRAAQSGAPSADEAAGRIAQAAATPGGEKLPTTLVETAAQVVRGDEQTRAALEEGAQQAVNPEQRGASPAAIEEGRDLVIEALIERMKPLQKADVRLFLAINRLPHTPTSNGAMYALTTVMNGGWGWVIGLLVAMLFDRKRALRVLNSIILPLWFATMAVEFPIKHYFRRQRPFINVVQAIAIGRKPGGYSFPSGHSAAAFAGAWLMSRHYPAQRPLWYAIAVLVAFSRVYLGAHYPGDVTSGALVGTTIAELVRRAMVLAESDE